MCKLAMMTRMLVSLLLMVSLLSCASTSKSVNTAELVDDSAITARVKALFSQDEYLKQFTIIVETYKGVVQLNGEVDSQLTSDTAETITKSVKGVVAVQNNLIHLK